jgi:hypothetical protein
MWKLIGRFPSERPKIIKIFSIRNHQVGVRYMDDQRDVPVLHTGLISCSTGTSIPPKVENPGSTSVVGSRD